MNLKKRHKKSAKSASVGERIISGLREFRDALAAKEPLEGKFVVRTVGLNLRPAEYTAAKVRDVRGQLKISQSLFAKLLGVSPKTVQVWEQGVVKPSGMARRFLDEIRLQPDYYRQRLADSIKPVTRGTKRAM